ncbi:endonuclease/exonuclease/phosphatase family protein [Blastococcus sp. TF02A-30]|uniref:endonuclease/exonuclease/phosphatase family protein n=1 Tax=Blastococcus sp. TF02A-30 TaxID=2250580 RepID=UPI000DEAF6F5|nr:endonuclease/exonuclease/phosphatase family protein [Blastococcus sp. TF02A-30]RBY92609.1 endonuclease/exonuclease/phosphatase family protein [Blastococcus sp. TF02A-30]
MPSPRRTATAAALPWAAWAVLRATGTERGFPLVPAISFTPYAALTAVLPLGLALRAGSRPAAVLAGAAGIALAAPVLSRARPAAPLPAGGGRRVRVATVSLRRGHVPAAGVVDLVRAADVDVLAVAELTPGSEALLRAAGLDRLLPEEHVLPARPGAVLSASGALWSRLPITGRGAVPGEFEQPSAVLDVGGRPLEVVAVHSAPPAVSPRAVRRWAADLAALPSPSAAVPQVLAGDFNATADHAAFRSLLAAGWTDAAQATGQGLAWTWRPLRLKVPRLTLDHVLVGPRVGVTAVRFVPVPGSDHRSVVADLALPG